jgi:hypothetical protein
MTGFPMLPRRLVAGRRRQSGRLPQPGVNVFDRFDICEAYWALENDFNVGGILQERGRQVAAQLHRMGFRPRPSLGGFETLTDNGQDIYRAACERFGLRAPEYT